ncbi:MAG: hypothetical protein JWP49_2728 [Phenylobacterium sp.]|jgi:uncharacterized protein YodC (DUF2158 family)|nr:hypothetical protein [Phenylobacterium sp.]
MADEFKKGDIVRLKSGGPLMTVTNVGEVHMTGAPSVWCSWFNSKFEPNESVFPIETVVKPD